MAQESGLRLVRKAVEVLDVLARERELTPAQLAEITEEPRSSVYRLLAGLQQLEMVDAGSRRGTYRLGFHLVRLGEAVIAGYDERQLALPVMQRIHDETGETVFLCVKRDNDAVCIERIDGRRVQSLALRLGGSLPLHAGAASRVLLSYTDREFWNAYIAAGQLKQFTPTTPVTADTLIPLLEETKRTGVAVSDGDVTVGIAAVGVPITDYRGSVRAALSVSGVRPAILGSGARQLRELLVDSGREISKMLGADLSAR